MDRFGAMVKCFPRSVTEVFDRLYELLGHEVFLTLFPVILTDNGSEFSNPKEIEYRDSVPCLRAKVFYCDPSVMTIKKGHRLIS